MNITLLELEELQEMKETVKRNIQSLEVCLNCDSVSECEMAPVDDGSPVWLCRACAARLLDGKGTARFLGL